MAIKLTGLDVVFKGEDLISPILTKISKNMADIERAFSFVSGNIADFVSRLSGVFGGLVIEGDKITLISDEVARLSAMMQASQKGADSMQSGLERTREQILKTQKQAEELTRIFLQSGKVSGRQIDVLRRMIKALEDLDDELEEKQKEMNSFMKALKQVGSVLKEVFDDLDKTTSAFLEAGVATGKLKDMYDRLLKVYPGLLSRTALSISEFKSLTAELTKMGKTVGEQTEILEKFGILVGALGLEEEQLLSFVRLATISRMTGQQMLDAVVGMTVFAQKLDGIAITATKAFEILSAVPDLAAEMGVAFDKHFVLRFSANLTALATAITKNIGISIDESTGLAIAFAKRIAGISGDIRSFMAGLSDELSTNTMLMLEVLFRGGTFGAKAFQMLIDPAANLVDIFNAVQRAYKGTLDPIMRMRIQQILVANELGMFIPLLERGVDLTSEQGRRYLLAMKGAKELRDAFDDLRASLLSSGNVIAKIIKLVQSFIMGMIEGMQIFIGSSGTIDDLSKSISDLGKMIGETLAGFVEAMRVIVPVLRFVAYPLKLLLQFFNMFTGTLDSTSSSLMKSGNMFLFLGGAILSVVSGITKLVNFFVIMRLFTRVFKGGIFGFIFGKEGFFDRAIKVLLSIFKFSFKAIKGQMSLGKMFGELGKVIVETFNLQPLVKFGAGLKLYIAKGFELVRDKIISVFTRLKLDKLLDGLIKGIGSILGKIGKLFSKFGASIGQFFSSIFPKNIGSGLGKGFLKIIGKMGGLLTILTTFVAEFFSSEGTFGQRIIRALIKTAVIAGTMFLGSLLGSIVPGLGTALGGLLGAVVGGAMADTVADALVPVKKEAESTIKDLESVDTGSSQDFGNPHNPDRVSPVSFVNRGQKIELSSGNIDLSGVIGKLDEISDGIKKLQRTVLTSVDIKTRGDISRLVDINVQKELIVSGSRI